MPPRATYRETIARAIADIKMAGIKGDRQTPPAAPDGVAAG
jgi:hypothetical protein